jgi:hypothetical protein
MEITSVLMLKIIVPEPSGKVKSVPRMNADLGGRGLFSALKRGGLIDGIYRSSGIVRLGTSGTNLSST